MALSYHPNEIVRLGKHIAAIDAGNLQLKYARKWWANGCICRYSNEDFDIMQALESELDRLYEDGLFLVDDNSFVDYCPRHGNDVKAEYNFGLQDATVYTYSNCRCACSVKGDSFATASYWKSYANAEGHAKLIVATESEKNAPFA